jgi:hypothetical protein
VETKRQRVLYAKRRKLWASEAGTSKDAVEARVFQECARMKEEELQELEHTIELSQQLCLDGPKPKLSN